MVMERELQRDELDLLWTIDRSERIVDVYRVVGGDLVREHAPFDAQGWAPGEQSEQGHSFPSPMRAADGAGAPSTVPPSWAPSSSARPSSDHTLTCFS